MNIVAIDPSLISTALVVTSGETFKMFNYCGQFFTNKLKGFFDEGNLITIYSHYSLRLYTFDKNKKVFKVHHSDFGKIFLTKEEFRNKKIKKVLK